MKIKNKFILILLAILFLLNFIPNSASAATDDTQNFRITLTIVQFRTAPNTSSTIYQKLNTGTVVTFTGNRSEDKTFAEVTYNGTTGWVSAKYLAGFTTTFISRGNTNAPNSIPNRVHNINLASKTLTRTVLMPGQTFSALGILGNCNEEKGYKPAPTIVGDSTVDGPGGGVCQVTTTINIAVKKAGIKTEAIKHTGGVSYAKPQDEATISYDSKNFTFQNPYNYPILLEVISSNGNCVCNVYKVNK